MRLVKTKDVYNYVLDNIKKQTLDLGYIIVDCDYIFPAEHNLINEELCKELGYGICKSPHYGGTIVANKGDRGFYYFSSYDNGFIENFIDYFTSWLIGKGLNAYFTDNDILVDGFKVCGLSLQIINNVYVTAAYIGVNTDIEAIKKICNKPMVKKPKGLSKYGITSEDIDDMFKEFASKYGYN